MKKENKENVDMMKRFCCLLCGIWFTLFCEGEMSETDRITIGGIEWLYTVDFEARRVVLEKAILLTSETGVYEMTLALDGTGASLFGKNLMTGKYYVDEWGGKYDVWIGASAFEGNEYLKSIEIVPCKYDEISLTICENAFKDCIYLERIDTFYEGHDDRDIPIRIKSIGASAFENVGSGNGWGQSYFCDTNTFDVTTITNVGQKAFYNAAATLPSSMLSDALQYVGDYAFATDYSQSSQQVSWSIGGNTGLGIVTVPKNAKMGSNVFTGNLIYGNVILTSTYVPSGCFSQSTFGFNPLLITEGVVEIGNNAFNGVRGIDSGCKTLVLPQTLQKIGDYAFAGDWGTFNCGMKGEGHDKHPYHYYSTLRGELIIPEGVKEIGIGAFAYNPYLERIVIAGRITSLASYTFNLCFGLSEIVLPNTIKSIGSDVFKDCTNLTVRIPSSVVELKADTAGQWGEIKHVIFEGAPPEGIKESKLIMAKEVWLPVEYQSYWAPYFRPNMKFAKKVDGAWVALGGKVISNAMRASDPTIMDIKYKVTSTKDKVNVRILAYKDGIRSFANALPLATFVDGTEANVGNGVAANVEHTVSWQVSKDWDADLAKVSVEVFVKEDNLLPLQLTTIPAKDGHPSVTFSRNEQSSEKVMNALYWLYADKTSGLTLENGVLKSEGKQLVNGTTLSTENALSYIYSKMGYGLLLGDTLKYVNNLMRSSISSGKFAVKEGAAE